MGRQQARMAMEGLGPSGFCNQGNESGRQENRPYRQSDGASRPTIYWVLGDEQSFARRFAPPTLVRNCCRGYMPRTLPKTTGPPASVLTIRAPAPCGSSDAGRKTVCNTGWFTDSH